MSNGHWRGDNPDSKLYDGWKLSKLEDFIVNSQKEISLEDKQLFFEASSSFLMNDYLEAENKFSFLSAQGHMENPAIIHNLKLSQMKKSGE